MRLTRASSCSAGSATQSKRGDAAATAASRMLRSCRPMARVTAPAAERRLPSPPAAEADAAGLPRDLSAPAPKDVSSAAAAASGPPPSLPVLRGRPLVAAPTDTAAGAEAAADAAADRSGGCTERGDSAAGLCGCCRSRPRSDGGCSGARPGGLKPRPAPPLSPLLPPPALGLLPPLPPLPPSGLVNSPSGRGGGGGSAVWAAVGR